MLDHVTQFGHARVDFRVGLQQACVFDGLRDGRGVIEGGTSSATDQHVVQADVDWDVQLSVSRSNDGHFGVQHGLDVVEDVGRAQSTLDLLQDAEHFILGEIERVSGAWGEEVRRTSSLRLPWKTRQTSRSLWAKPNPL